MHRVKGGMHHHHAYGYHRERREQKNGGDCDLAAKAMGERDGKREGEEPDKCRHGLNDEFGRGLLQGYGQRTADKRKHEMFSLLPFFPSDKDSCH